MNSKNTLLIVAVVSIIGGGLLGFFIKSIQSPQLPIGSSTLPSIDIMAGDLPSASSDSIVNLIKNTANKSISVDNLSIRDYQKTYTSGSGTNYTVSFVADVSNIKSSYQITYQIVDNKSLGSFASCALNQKTGYTCTDTNNGEGGL